MLRRRCNDPSRERLQLVTCPHPSRTGIIRHFPVWSVPFSCNTFKVSLRGLVSWSGGHPERSDKRTHSVFVLPKIGEDDSHGISASRIR